MKNFSLLLVLALPLSSAFAAESAFPPVSWDANIGARYYVRSVDDGLAAKNSVSGHDTSRQVTKALQYRAGIAGQGQVKGVDWRIGIRTKNAANNDYTLLQQNADPSIGIESGWVRFKTEVLGGDLSGTFGRQRGSFVYDETSENFFGEPVRFDGLGWLYERGIFSLGLGQYSLGAVSNGSRNGSTYTTTDHLGSQGSTTSSMAFLLTAQPRVRWAISEKVQTTLAAGFYHWSRNDSFYTNTLHGGVTSASTGATTGTVSVNNARQLQIYNSWDFPFDVRLVGEWVKNFASVNYPNSQAADRNAWVAGLQYGSTMHTHGALASYSYTHKGAGAVVGELSSSLILPDNKGHIITLAYAFADNFDIRGRAILLDEISGATANAAAGTALLTQESHKTTIWEVASNFRF